MTLDLTKDIIQYPMPLNQYMQVETAKNAVVLHGTAGNAQAKNVYDYWNSTAERVATCVVVAGDGKIWQGFSSKFWGAHIGQAHGLAKWGLPFYDYSQNTIGVEICNWGFLTKKGEKFYSWTNQEVPKDQVVEYPRGFRGQKYFQKYTQAQIDSVEKLLRYWNKIYGIPLDYREKDMWELSENAHRKVAGIYTHNSYRLDKSDIHPQPEMIAMLKNLNIKIEEEK
ncbi:MAG: N-acetylmuramoyl-L-alanine amidase [Bacteroidetes bacterium]|nr:N-acetylmuramoyl-L-alanine amidase [Bacteroidota bacterium]